MLQFVVLVRATVVIPPAEKPSTEQPGVRVTVDLTGCEDYIKKLVKLKKEAEPWWLQFMSEMRSEPNTARFLELARGTTAATCMLHLEQCPSVQPVVQLVLDIRVSKMLPNCIALSSTAVCTCHCCLSHKSTGHPQQISKVIHCNTCRLARVARLHKRG